MSPECPTCSLNSTWLYIDPLHIAPPVCSSASCQTPRIHPGPSLLLSITPGSASPVESAILMPFTSIPVAHRISHLYSCDSLLLVSLHESAPLSPSPHTSPFPTLWWSPLSESESSPFPSFLKSFKRFCTVFRAKFRLRLACSALHSLKPYGLSWSISICWMISKNTSPNWHLSPKFKNRCNFPSEGKCPGFSYSGHICNFSLKFIRVEFTWLNESSH